MGLWEWKRKWKLLQGLGFRVRIEKTMEPTMAGYIGTTRIHSFIPAQGQFCGRRMGMLLRSQALIGVIQESFLIAHVCMYVCMYVCR